MEIWGYFNVMHTTYVGKWVFSSVFVVVGLHLELRGGGGEEAKVGTCCQLAIGWVSQFGEDMVGS